MSTRRLLRRTRCAACSTRARPSRSSPMPVRRACRTLGSAWCAVAVAGGHEVTVVPGPSAVIAALIASGLPAHRFVLKASSLGGVVTARTHAGPGDRATDDRSLRGASSPQPHPGRPGGRVGPDRAVVVSPASSPSCTRSCGGARWARPLSMSPRASRGASTCSWWRGRRSRPRPMISPPAPPDDIDACRCRRGGAKRRRASTSPTSRPARRPMARNSPTVMVGVRKREPPSLRWMSTPRCSAPTPCSCRCRRRHRSAPSGAAGRVLRPRSHPHRRFVGVHVRRGGVASWARAAVVRHGRGRGGHVPHARGGRRRRGQGVRERILGAVTGKRQQDLVALNETVLPKLLDSVRPEARKLLDPAPRPRPADVHRVGCAGGDRRTARPGPRDDRRGRHTGHRRRRRRCTPGSWPGRSAMGRGRWRRSAEARPLGGLRPGPLLRLQRLGERPADAGGGRSPGRRQPGRRGSATLAADTRAGPSSSSAGARSRSCGARPPASARCHWPARRSPPAPGRRTADNSGGLGVARYRACRGRSSSPPPNAPPPCGAGRRADTRPSRPVPPLPALTARRRPMTHLASPAVATLLPDDTDLLRQRRAAPRPRLHDAHRRRHGPLAPPARRRRLLPHRHRRARAQDPAGRRGHGGTSRRRSPTRSRRSSEAWKRLDITYDDFIRTTEPAATRAVRSCCRPATTPATSSSTPTGAGTASPARSTTPTTSSSTTCARSTVVRSSASRRRTTSSASAASRTGCSSGTRRTPRRSCPSSGATRRSG